jgi:hypothetical protein
MSWSPPNSSQWLCYLRKDELAPINEWCQKKLDPCLCWSCLCWPFAFAFALVHPCMLTSQSALMAIFLKAVGGEKYRRWRWRWRWRRCNDAAVQVPLIYVWVYLLDGWVKRNRFYHTYHPPVLLTIRSLQISLFPPRLSCAGRSHLVSFCQSSSHSKTTTLQWENRPSCRSCFSAFNLRGRSLLLYL